MFNPLENEILDKWFRRFNAPLKCLPAEERAELHQEVRQHLDPLVAANEELGSTPLEAWAYALQQFGDPVQIGRRLRHEAQHLSRDPNKWASHPLTAAAAYSFAVCTLGVAGIWAVTMTTLCLLWANAPALPESSLGHSVMNDFLGLGVTASSAFAGWLTGSKMKRSALAGVFCALLSLGGPLALLLLLADHDVSGAASAVAWIGVGCLSAWRAECRKRKRDHLAISVG